MPLTMPPPKYFWMPSLVVGAALLSNSARNWRPKSRSRTHRPSAVTHSPGLAAGNDPTTVTSSRWPLALTLSTAKPFSSLKKVTRSIRPDRLSGGGGVWLEFKGGERLADAFPPASAHLAITTTAATNALPLNLGLPQSCRRFSLSPSEGERAGVRGPSWGSGAQSASEC